MCRILLQCLNLAQPGIQDPLLPLLPELSLHLVLAWCSEITIARQGSLLFGTQYMLSVSSIYTLISRMARMVLLAYEKILC